MKQAGYLTGRVTQGNGALPHTEDVLLVKEFTQSQDLVGNMAD